MVVWSFKDSLHGLLVGTAVGDALGLPAEGLSPRQIQRRWGNEWRMRLLFGRGMVSDDTEHTIMVAQSLLSSGNDPAIFQRRLASKLRWWLLALPAGVGFATARGILKLWCGIPPSRSGVCSAGNGPAMRVAIIGGFFAFDTARRRQFTAAATRLTHTDERAEIAAGAVAEAAAWIVRRQRPFEEFVAGLPELSTHPEWSTLCCELAKAHKSRATVGEFAQRLGLQHGVTGYAFHTVPIALYAYLRHQQDFQAALTAALSCGGDTDTVGAIVGALVGASVGQTHIPSEWQNKIVEWPCSLRFLEKLAIRLSQANQTHGEIRLFWPGVVVRNLFFLAIVLGHGFRRLFPPYA